MTINFTHLPKGTSVLDFFTAIATCVCNLIIFFPPISGVSGVLGTILYLQHSGRYQQKDEERQHPA